VSVRIRPAPLMARWPNWQRRSVATKVQVIAKTETTLYEVDLKCTHPIREVVGSTPTRASTWPGSSVARAPRYLMLMCVKMCRFTQMIKCTVGGAVALKATIDTEGPSPEMRRPLANTSDEEPVASPNDDTMEIPKFDTLDFSEFHPLDHSLITCSGYPGGRRTHLRYWWEFKGEWALKAHTLCKIGRHHPVTWHLRDGSTDDRCLHCGKKEE
jgi:hypothetical protein